MKHVISSVAIIVSLSTTALAKPAVKSAGRISQAPKVVATPPILFNFKGITLEIPLDDFRKLPHPDGNESVIVCTGEKTGLRPYEMVPPILNIYDPIEKSLGVIKCRWYVPNSLATSGLNLAASSYTTTNYWFSFIKDPKDGVMRLYEFSSMSDISAFGEVVDALTAKWGNPLTASGKVQNKMGSWFEQTTAVWSNALSSISVQSRFNKIDEFGIIVTDQRLSKIISDARTAKKAAIPNAI